MSQGEVSSFLHCVFLPEAIPGRLDLLCAVDSRISPYNELRQFQLSFRPIRILSGRFLPESPPLPASMRRTVAPEGGVPHPRSLQGDN